jgi:hypothetical protein
VIKKEDSVNEGKEVINKETSNRPKEQANSVRILCLFKMLGESRVNPDVLHRVCAMQFQSYTNVGENNSPRES